MNYLLKLNKLWSIKNGFLSTCYSRTTWILSSSDYTGGGDYCWSSRSRCFGTDGSWSDDEEMNKLVDDSFLRKELSEGGAVGGGVFVVQPYIKHGPRRIRNTTPELQLAEAVALVATVSDWHVVGQMTVGLNCYVRGKFFSKGKLDDLKDAVRSVASVSSVFISVNMLNSVQHEFLENEFGVPVFDRYLVVIRIFREHATSTEARLQIAMAEIPYLYSRMSYIYARSLSRIGSKAAVISGTTVHTSPEARKMALRSYERRVKMALERVRAHRAASRERRRELQHPVVAVVGYTNAGKTSLIKALTGGTKLLPRDHLFATLDVTFHVGTLPSNLKVFYVDTIGFISEIPDHLLEPFRVTLQDALNADLILHVQDISHPDWVAQKEQVERTLEKLNLEEKMLSHVISIANKMDIMSTEKCRLIPSDMVSVSCAKQTGLTELKEKIENEVIAATNRKHIVIRAKTSGEEYKWLHSETTIADQVADPKDPNYSLLSVLLTDSTLERFKHKFIYAKRSNKFQPK